MVVTAEITLGQLAELIKQVRAGNEVLLTQDSKPVARLVPAAEADSAPHTPAHFRSLKGHRALIPVISQQDLADEMFSEQ